MNYIELSSLSVEFGKQNKDSHILNDVETMKVLANISTYIEESDYSERDLSTGYKVLSTLSLKDGRIEYTTRDLSVHELCGIQYFDSVASANNNCILTEITLKDGKISATGFTLISDNYVAIDADIAQSKIYNLTTDLQNLSNDISNKIYIEDFSVADLSNGDYCNLSVLKLKAEDYEQRVADGNINDRTIYIVSSDYINAYDQVIINLSTPGFEGVSAAANIIYVDKITDYLRKDLYQLSNELCFTSCDLSNQLCATSSEIAISVHNLSTYAQGLSDFIRDTISVDLYQLSNELCFTSCDLSSLLCSISVILELQDNYLSSKIDDLSDAATVWIKNPDDPLVSGIYTDLSVIKLDLSAYEKLAIDNSLDSRTIYITSADYIDAYEQDIRALSTPGIEGVSNAANTLYVDDKVDAKAKEISLALKNELSSLLKLHMASVDFAGEDAEGNVIHFNILSAIGTIW